MHVLFGSWYLLFNHCKYDVMYTLYSCLPWSVVLINIHTTACVTCFSCVDSYTTQKHPRVSTFFFCGKTKTSWKVLSIIEKYLLNKATRFHSSTCLYISNIAYVVWMFQTINWTLSYDEKTRSKILPNNESFHKFSYCCLWPHIYFGEFLWHWQVRSQNMASHGEKTTTSAYSIITYN